MKIYNTLTRRKEEFSPIEEGKVKMYACGITVSGEPHIGHGFQALIYDIMRKYLEKKGYKVKYARNYTDVDDKIIAKSKETGIPADKYAAEMIEKTNKIMGEFGVDDPDVWLKATENIGNIIDFIEQLIKSGHAYPAPSGDVYFSVASFPAYGCLSNRTVEDMLDGVRVENAEDKRDPADFALWKAAKPGEICWDSPWGMGRPGWHIECSAMNRAAFGDQIDIHGGGRDLIFPHHENEIAQSESLTGKRFAKYWTHNGLIKVNGQKMSKSLGNFFTVLDILKEYEPEVLRYFILQTHYRSPLDFSDVRLKEASRSLERLRTAAQNLTELKGVISVGPDEDSLALREKVSGFVESFLEAMRDDFNTSLAISYLFALGKEINILHQSVMTGGQKPDGKLVDMMDKAWKEMTSIIGILEEDPGAKTEAVKDADEDAAAIESLIAERQEARKAKDFKKADAIRDELAQKGILLEDTPQGVRWKRQ